MTIGKEKARSSQVFRISFLYARYVKGKVMKILHITTNDFMGAGWCVLRIHRALLSQGVDSKVLVANKHSRDYRVYEMKPNCSSARHKPHNKYLRKIYTFFYLLGFFKTKSERASQLANNVKWNTAATWYAPITDYDLLQSELVKEADIIHLHWIAGFVDYESFFKGINKPIVWTLHDENIALGGFHFTRDKRYNYECCKQLEDNYARIKQKALSQVKDLHIVALSDMMQQFIESQPFLSNRPLHRIYNSVDCDVYRMQSQTVSRSVLGIPVDAVVFVFCAYRLYDERKGLRDLIKAIEALANDKIAILCIGGGEMPTETTVPTFFTGEVESDRLMSFVYSAADYFAMPSYQEVFAQTPLEAMACGLPVVAYPCSGTSDLISDFNGVVCSDFTVEAFKEGMQKLMETKYDKNRIRNHIIEHFTPQHIAGQYIDLYQTVLAS